LFEAFPEWDMHTLALTEVTSGRKKSITVQDWLFAKYWNVIQYAEQNGYPIQLTRDIKGNIRHICIYVPKEQIPLPLGDASDIETEEDSPDGGHSSKIPF